VKRRAIAILCAAAAFLGFAATASAAFRGSGGREHRFAATYAGTGHGQTAGTTASGSATLRGRGRLIGKGTLRGSGRGTFTSSTCVTFDGNALLSGKTGSLRLAARGARACASSSNGDLVSFSGSASVTGGTATFAGARGRLSFSGSFDRATGAVRITLSGRIRYRA
jgi:hypothetical protein